MATSNAAFFSSARRDFSNLCRKGRPTLRPADIVIIDNLGSHKGKAVCRLIRRGRQASVPAEILPDLNLIEQVFAKLKHPLRKAAARTIDATGQAIGQLPGTFTPEECANYFRNSGLRANLDSSRFRGEAGGDQRGRLGSYTLHG